MNVQNFETYKFSNGIRVIHKQVDSLVSHCGFIINTGSRDETTNEHGLAHFIEHVIFKGTKKRKAYHILSRLEDIGGELNAYTAKEDTAVYASFLNQYYDRTIELLVDIIFNSTFPTKEIEKEKEVVIDEINSYLDNPAEQINDDFEEIVFASHTIGKNILGTPEKIKSFEKNHIINFINRTYNTDEIVFSSIGNIKFSKLIKILEKYIDPIPSNKRIFKRKPFNNYKPILKTINKSTYQTHCVLGNIAYDIRDNKRTGLTLLNNILGGTGMNSRLNLAIREKYGFCYNLESNYTPFTDTGIIAIYFGTDNEYLDKTIRLVNKELEKLREIKLGISQFKKAKMQMIGQLAIMQEANVNEMISIGKSYLYFNKVDTIEEIYAKLNDINVIHLQEIANDIFEPNKMSMLIFKSSN